MWEKKTVRLRIPGSLRISDFSLNMFVAKALPSMCSIAKFLCLPGSTTLVHPRGWASLMLVNRTFKPTKDWIIIVISGYSSPPTSVMENPRISVCKLSYTSGSAVELYGFGLMLVHVSAASGCKWMLMISNGRSCRDSLVHNSTRIDRLLKAFEHGSISWHLLCHVATSASFQRHLNG